MALFDNGQRQARQGAQRWYQRFLKSYQPGMVDFDTNKEIQSLIGGDFESLLGQATLGNINQLNARLKQAGKLTKASFSSQDPKYVSRRFLSESIRLQQQKPGKAQVVLSNRTPFSQQANNLLDGSGGIMSPVGGR